MPKRPRQDIVFRFFLVVDDVLDLRAAATAPFHRPVDADKSRLVFAPLEILGAFHRARRILTAAVALHLARFATFRIGIEEGAGFGAERGFLRRVFEIHRIVLLCRGQISGVAGPQLS